MAYAVELTLGTGNKVSLNYQSEEVNVSITYKLEREDGDVLGVVHAKAPELIEAHGLAWEQVREAKMPQTPAPVATTTQETLPEESAAEEFTSVLSSEDVNSLDERGVENDSTFQGEGLSEDNGSQEEQVPITPAQIQVILALRRALELDEKALQERLSIHAGELVLECLTQSQAAALIVELSRERRDQLDRERKCSG